MPTVTEGASRGSMPSCVWRVRLPSRAKGSVGRAVSICKTGHWADRGGGWETTIVLGDLVALRLVLVEVVLAVEAALRLDRAAQSEGCPQRRDQRLALEVRLCAGEGDIEEGDMGVGRVGGGCRGGGEELAGGVELGVDLDAHRQLPLLQTRIGALGFAIGIVLFALLAARFGFLAAFLVLQLFPEGHDVIVEARVGVKGARCGLGGDCIGAT